MYKTLGLSITRIEALGWKNAERACRGGEYPGAQTNPWPCLRLRCKDDVTLILYDPDSNEHVPPQHYQLPRYLARTRTDPFIHLNALYKYKIAHIT